MQTDKTKLKCLMPSLPSLPVCCTATNSYFSWLKPQIWSRICGITASFKMERIQLNTDWQAKFSCFHKNIDKNTRTLFPYNGEVKCSIILSKLNEEKRLCLQQPRTQATQSLSCPLKFCLPSKVSSTMEPQDSQVPPHMDPAPFSPNSALVKRPLTCDPLLWTPLPWHSL